MRILGIDFGDKKIGLSFGESIAGIAVPLDVVPNMGDATMEKFVRHVKAEDIDLIVVGVPLSSRSQAQVEKVRTFIAKLSAAVTIPVVEEDESFTTAESRRLQIEEGAKADEDALAAMLIVQQYINRGLEKEKVKTVLS